MTNNNNTTYLPSDIRSKALRDTYYKVQNLLAEKYTRDIAKVHSKDERRTIVENFKHEIRDTIKYYVNLSSK